MAIKISAAAQKSGMSEHQFRKKLRELGFKLDRKEDKLDEGMFTQFEKRLAEAKEDQQETKPKEKAKIEIPKVIAVKDLAERMQLPVADVIKELMKNGIMVTINENIDFETAAIISEDLGFKVKEEKIDLLKAVKAGQEISAKELAQQEEDPKRLKKCPPVVVIVGHVDHGKTTLLDAIRTSQVAKGEAGGITQQISAYQVKKGNKLITFVDTPGHEAFKKMRAEGTKATDIAVLVVAANEGVKPQTVEAIKYAQEAKVPVIVAITKIDLPGANVDKVKKELGEYEILSDEWGGKNVFVPVSGVTKEGIDQLLEMILLVTDIEDFKANPDRKAVGTVIESRLDRGRGPLAVVLVRTGTLKRGDYVVAGETWGKIRFLEDYRGRKLKSAPPSTPVLIGGLRKVPLAGGVLQAVDSETKAKEVIENLRRKQSLDQLKKTKEVNLDELTSQIKESKVKKLKLVLKADVKGSLEAIKECLKAIGTSEVAVSLVRAEIGTISEDDIDSACAADRIVVGFNVGVDPVAKKLAQHEKVKILQFKVIYELIEQVKDLMSELLAPEVIETVSGRVKILKVFKTGKKDMIFGGKVTKGKVEPNQLVRIIRDKKQIGEGRIESIQQEKKSVSLSKEGAECGMHYFGEPIVQEGDTVEIFSRTEKKRTLK
jgi:translation initiation factor IF-2